MNAPPWVIAHRGASAVEQDNSLEAFARAIELGADMVEFDIRRTKDGALVAFHDGAIQGRALAEYTHDEIAAVTGVRPPLLEEILELTDGRVGLDVEFKEDGYVERVTATIRRHFEPEELVITSFADRVIAQVKESEPGIRTGLLVGLERPERLLRTRLSELFPVGRVRACGADYVAPHFKLADLGVLRRANSAGIPCLIWTVNDASQIEKYLRDPRVAAVITDRPEIAVPIRSATRKTAAA